MVGWVGPSINFIEDSLFFDPPRCHSQPYCTLALCWEPSIQQHEIFTPRLCWEKGSFSCGSHRTFRQVTGCFIATLSVIVAFRFLSDLTFASFSGVSRFYEAQFWEHLFFMLSELCVMHARFVKLGIRTFSGFPWFASIRIGSKITLWTAKWFVPVRFRCGSCRDRFMDSFGSIRFGSSLYLIALLLLN